LDCSKNRVEDPEVTVIDRIETSAGTGVMLGDSGDLADSHLVAGNSHRLPLTKRTLVKACSNDSAGF
jgi:hypothetical protein